MNKVDLEKGTMVVGPLWVGALIFGVPIALFFGLMTAMLVSLIWPGGLDLVAPLYCEGMAETVVHRYNPTPGETTWTSETYCTDSNGVTRAIGWQALLTASAILALPIWIGWTWYRAARRRRLGIVPGQPFPAPERILELARKRRGLETSDAGRPDVETRLTELRRLRDRGLIDAEDYAAKKAAILEEL